MQTKSTVRLIIATVSIVGFFAMLGLLLFFEIPATNRDAILTLLGGFMGAFLTIIAFYFGDSEGQEKKRS